MKKHCFIALILGMVLMGCEKPAAYESPGITETTVELQSASVCFTAKVNFTGNANMIMELATLQDMSDKQEYTMNLIDETTFSVNVLDLNPFVDYYYRMIVSNENFSQNTSVKCFSISSDMLSYGDDRFKTRIGVHDGGTYEWAIMFPPSVLSSYSGAHVSKIRFRAGELGQYYIKIYSGGTSSPSSLLRTKDYEVTEIGWHDIELYPVSFASTQPLWIAISCTHEAEEFPAAAGYGVDNANTRWRRVNNGSWADAAEGLEQDLSWLIRTYVNYISGDSKGQLIELPQASAVETEVENDVPCVLVEPF